MNDCLVLTGIVLHTRIGVSAAERKLPQRITVSLTLATDVAAVAAADDPSAGVDYAVLVEGLRTLERTERHTIERLAEDIATYVLEAFPVAEIRVGVTKHPPIEGIAEASVTIERRKDTQPIRRGPLIA